MTAAGEPALPEVLDFRVLDANRIFLRFTSRDDRDYRYWFSGALSGEWKSNPLAPPVHGNGDVIRHVISGLEDIHVLQ